MDKDNDGRFPDDSQVLVRYPRDKREEQGGRAAWPWLPGSIADRVCQKIPRTVVLRDQMVSGVLLARCVS